DAPLSGLAKVIPSLARRSMLPLHSTQLGKLLPRTWKGAHIASPFLFSPFAGDANGRAALVRHRCVIAPSSACYVNPRRTRDYGFWQEDCGPVIEWAALSFLALATLAHVASALLS